MIHALRHPSLDVPGCFACRISSVGIPASAVGDSRAQSANAMERQWDKDMSAYKRLRADGVQPRGIDGAARREATANDLKGIER